LIENLGTVSVEISSEELQEINTASRGIKVHGDRYSGGSAKLINRYFVIQFVINITD